MKKSNSEVGFFEVGTSYLIRTVTNYYTGRVVSVSDQFVVLEDAAWITDTGRFHQCVTNGEVEEVEPYKNPVAVGIGTIVDATQWDFALPRSQK